MNPLGTPSSLARSVTVGLWRRIVVSERRHLNDFCLFRDADRRWHAMGIVGTGTWESEQTIFHYVGESLDQPFQPLPDVLTQSPARGLPPQKHAPFVVMRDGVYHMVYRRPSGAILHTTTSDPNRWDDLGEVVFEERDARDVHIIEIAGVYHMYYCQSAHVDGPRATTLLRRSRDLTHWDEPIIVHYDTAQPATHGYLESPVVVARSEGYYLFIRHRLFESDQKTVVLFSDRPDRFPSGQQQWFAELSNVHAPEIVESEEQLYIARVSGAPGHVAGAPAEGGWVDIAPLVFT